MRRILRCSHGHAGGSGYIVKFECMIQELIPLLLLGLDVACENWSLLQFLYCHFFSSSPNEHL